MGIQYHPPISPFTCSRLHGPEHEEELQNCSQDLDEIEKEIQRSRDEVNDKKFLKYADQAYASEGFDVDSDNDSDIMGEIAPYIRPVEDANEYALEAANFAIGEYNKNKGSNLQLVKIVKSNFQFVAGIVHCITLEAKEFSNGEIKTYEAKVYSGVKENEWDLEIFRPSYWGVVENKTKEM